MNISRKMGICKLLAVFITVFILTGYVCADTSVFAQTETKEGTLYVDSKTVERGDKFTVTVSIKDNPGIWGLKFKVGYDHSALTLVAATNGKIFENLKIPLTYLHKGYPNAHPFPGFLRKIF